MKTLRLTVMVYHREKIQTAISQEKTCIRRSPWERSKVEFPLPTLHGVTDSLLPWHSHGTPPQSVSNKRHSSKPQGSECSLSCHYTGTIDWLIYQYTDWLPHGWLICRSTSNCMTQSPTLHHPVGLSGVASPTLNHPVISVWPSKQRKVTFQEPRAKPRPPLGQG